MSFPKPLHLLSVSLIFLSLSCEKLSVPPLVTTRPEAVSKFQKIIKEEYQIPAVVRDLDNTVWIYVPMEEHILELKAKPQGAQDSPPPAAPKKMALFFLDVIYENEGFTIAYDIAPAKQYGGADPGYENAYPENFQTKQRNVVGAVARAFLNMEDIPGDVEYLGTKKQITHEKLVNAYVKTDKPPDFFVIVFADIVRGIKMVNTTHFHDLKSAMNVSAPMPQEEYTKRYLSEVNGDAGLIGDKDGHTFQYKNIVLPEFLARQIEHRINLKYQYSSLPLGEDTVKEILRVVAETTQAYKFNNFKMINLHDLANDKTLAFQPSQLKTFQ